MVMKRLSLLAVSLATAVTTAITALAPAECGAAGQTQVAPYFLPMVTRTQQFNDGDQTGKLLYMRLTTARMLEHTDVFSNANQALIKIAEQEESQRLATQANMTAIARDMRSEQQKYGATSFTPFESTLDIYFQRADSSLISYLGLGATYEGGAHGLYGVYGKTIDTASGRELALDDIVTDWTALGEAIKAQLRFSYPSASFMESGSTLMEEMVDECIKGKRLTWSINPQGVSFYFNPYHIGSYSEGIFTVNILHSEYPDLFRNRQGPSTTYWKTPVEFAIDLIPYLKMRLSDSPRGDTIWIGSDTNGIDIDYCGEKLHDAVPAAHIIPTCIQYPDGRRYLLVDYSNDWRNYRLRVYALKETPVLMGDYNMTRRITTPEEENDQQWYVLTNPDLFYMTSNDGGGERLKCHFAPDGTLYISK